ncbi:hypothetical protein [Thermopetrobacter sp. TC1]|uniref:hypothetical protein n=1 Tax=Thermopetrobacter sp. TC1 TaxID=1495045 RepID=UPI000570B315|nr:hypothetical protein [Thermopetrobacter sp. TC1]
MSVRIAAFGASLFAVVLTAFVSSSPLVAAPHQEAAPQKAAAPHKAATSYQEARPWEYLRALQNVQNRLAEGDARAARTARALHRFLIRRMAAFPPRIWREKRNAEALFTWLLAGGRPDVAERLLAKKVPVALPKGALAGAVAYARGENARAWKLFSGISVHAFMTRNARAQFELAVAVLRASSDPPLALAHLDHVRLLKPGTLQEEVALRRGVWLAGMEGDVERAVRLAGIYLRRFNRSFYVDDFLKRLSVVLVRLDYGLRPSPLERIEPLLSRLSKRRRALLLAAMSRRALLDGKFALAAHAAKKARALYPNVARFAARTRLYRAAAEIARPDPEPILNTLNALDEKNLGERDRSLRLAALLVGRAIIDEPLSETLAAIRVKKKKGHKAKESTGKASASQKEQDDPRLARAEALAAQVERLLKQYADIP